MDGSKIVKKLVNQIIDDELLSLCTWTGKTNVKNVRKLELRKYNLLMNLLYETVLAADSRYTYKQFKTDMVKKVIKYAYAYQNPDQNTAENDTG